MNRSGASPRGGGGCRTPIHPSRPTPRRSSFPARLVYSCIVQNRDRPPRPFIDNRFNPFATLSARCSGKSRDTQIIRIYRLCFPNTFVCHPIISWAFSWYPDSSGLPDGLKRGDLPPDQTSLNPFGHVSHP